MVHIGWNWFLILKLLIDCSPSAMHPLKPQLNNDYLFQFLFIWMEHLFALCWKYKTGAIERISVLGI